ncbi:MAG TPA: hypothetical protein VNV43_06865 [Candidatus Acidoferrales bacterium]|jgi:hypothetical protein|nr:hypothetical protein [Candidatus Acidoferrales bacterium]
MKKPLLLAIVFIGAVIMALLFQRHPAQKMVATGETAKAKAVLPPPTLDIKPSSPAEPATNFQPSIALAPVTDPFQNQILELWRKHASPAEMAALLKELHQQDPKHLFQALLALSKTPLETRQTLVPLLANALTFWPDADGDDVFPIADAYGQMDLPSAAQWGATFLATTGRHDLNVAALLGQYAGTSESQALAMIATLPDAARAAALQDAAYHISTSDLNHLMTVCEQMDPNGSTAFSQLLFQRLAMENLNNTATWLAGTPQAQSLPGAASAIAQGLVLAGNAQQAITWADSLSDQTAKGQAIAEVYQQYTTSNPHTSIQDILAAYPATSELIPNGAAANLSGSGLTGYWDAASGLPDPSARAYAIAALVQANILTSGLADTQAKIAALPANSLEQNVAQMTLQSELANKEVALALQGGH